VVQRPGQTNNPLVLCGGVGMGKTHLLQAMRNELSKRLPDNSVYCSTETITSGLISSIRLDKIADFLDRLRGVDVLLIDDVQFLRGKERATGAFVRIFRQLHSEGKQIVIAGCRASKELNDIVDGLDIPIESGLIVEIEQPDDETMLDILHRKANRERIVLSDECAQSIAASVGNIRELEGALACLALQVFRNWSTPQRCILAATCGGVLY
jgi:chromosomal replication initiator protein